MIEAAVTRCIQRARERERDRQRESVTDTERQTQTQRQAEYTEHTPAVVGSIQGLLLRKKCIAPTFACSRPVKTNHHNQSQSEHSFAICILLWRWYYSFEDNPQKEKNGPAAK